MHFIASSRSSTALLACGLVLLCSAKAEAAHCPAIAGGSPALAQADADARLRFIQERLRHDANNARIWSWLWGSTYATLTVVNLAISPAFNSNERIDYFVSAGSSAVGVLSFLLSPLAVMRDQRRLDQLIAHDAGGDRCALLSQAERLLVRDAKSEAFGKSLIVRFGGVIFNVGVGALLGFAFGHWGEATINMMAGVVVGQVMIATQPDDVVGDLARYRGGELGGANAAANPGAGLRWLPLPAVFHLPGPGSAAAGPPAYGLSLSLPF